jgi:hypothetical protein
LVFIFPILFVLVLVFFSLPRYMAMLTSKIPVWPKEIEAQCQIAEDDPYRLDESNNSTTPWLDLFRRPKPNGETP